MVDPFFCDEVVHFQLNFIKDSDRIRGWKGMRKALAILRERPPY